MKEDNNELENFYRKAAENFPLKQGESDWQFIESKLNNEEDKKPVFGLFTRTAIMSLFILLMVATFSIYTLNQKTKTTQSAITVNTSDKQKEHVEYSNQKQIERKQLEEDITKIVYKKIIDSLEKHTHKNIRKNIAQKQKIDGIWTLTTTKAFNTKSVKAKSQEAALHNSEISGAVSKALNKSNLVVSDNSNHSKKEVFLSLKQDSNLAKNTAINLEKEKISNTNITNKNTLKDKSIVQQKIYLGVLGSAEINMLGFNREPGNDEPFDAGISIIAGYNLTKKISIESGIAFKRKTYYSSSNKFNSSILPLKGNMLGIESENELIEIPLTINYSLVNKKKHRLFAGLGTSSYIVNKEFYEYEEDVNGTIHQEQVIFNNATSNFFASLNLSLGYEYVLKNKISIRLQPYYNIPLAGLGKGKEPVSSKGINIGCIYHF